MIGYTRIRLFICLIILFFSTGNIFSQPGDNPVPAASTTSKYLSYLQHKRVAIMANQTSLIGHTHLVDSLIKLHIKIVRIFGPEHGFRGNSEAGATIRNGRDKKTGIKIISLYGKKVKPTPEDMKGIDVFVFDIQDVGVRFYTYISSLAKVMEACAEASIPLILLDRPNPNGFYMDGPVLKPEFKSFVGLFPVPVVYGMTIGEFATMLNGEGWLKDRIRCNLTVIKCGNYTHTSRYPLPVAPSPNLQTERAVLLYPSLALFEGTKISLGRGTDFPFEAFGHPQMLNCSFTFTPRDIPSVSMDPPQKGKLCYGRDLRNINIDSLRKTARLSLEYLLFAYNNIASRDSFFIPYFTLLTGNKELQNQVEKQVSESQIRESWNADLLKFKAIRKKYILYPDFE